MPKGPGDKNQIVRLSGCIQINMIAEELGNALSALLLSARILPGI
jgi:hypothetical protein